MIQRYCHNKIPSTTCPTIPIDFNLKQINIDDKVIKLVISDRTGKREWNASPKIMYKRMNGVLIIYDITDKQSFDDINNWN